MAEVRLVDLEIIKRYSLAVRREKVPADELLAVIDASRAAVVAAMGTPPSSKGRRARAAQAAGAKKPASAGRAAAQRAPAADPGPDPHADRDVIDEQVAS